MQCTCVALTFVCYCHHLVTASLDLHSIVAQKIDDFLHLGTKTYISHIDSKHQGKQKYLQMNELPDTIAADGFDYSVKSHIIFAGLIGTQRTDTSSLCYTLRDAFTAAFEFSSSCLITVGHNSGSAYTSAVYKAGESYLCFDSHSRDSSGVCSASGKAVLIEIESLTALTTYVNDLSKSPFKKVDETAFELASFIFEPLPIIHPSTVLQDDQFKLRQQHHASRVSRCLAPSDPTIRMHPFQPRNIKFPVTVFGSKKSVRFNRRGSTSTTG